MSPEANRVRYVSVEGSRARGFPPTTNWTLSVKENKEQDARGLLQKTRRLEPAWNWPRQVNRMMQPCLVAVLFPDRPLLLLREKPLHKTTNKARYLSLKTRKTIPWNWLQPENKWPEDLMGRRAVDQCLLWKKNTTLYGDTTRLSNQEATALRCKPTCSVLGVLLLCMMINKSLIWKMEVQSNQELFKWVDLRRC